MTAGRYLRALMPQYTIFIGIFAAVDLTICDFIYTTDPHRNKCCATPRHTGPAPEGPDGLST
jgi:hypothetical protein